MSRFGIAIKWGTVVLSICAFAGDCWAAENSREPALTAPPHWIWKRPAIGEQKVKISRGLKIERSIQTAELQFAADFCEANVTINGRRVLSFLPYCQTQTIDVTPWVKRGARPAASVSGQAGSCCARARIWRSVSSGATVSLSAEGGAGMVTAFNESGAPVLKLNAALQAFVVFSTGGTPIAALSKTRTNAGGEVAIYGPGGDVVFGAASMPEGGGAACAKRASGKGDCLGVGLPLMGGGN